MNNYIYTRIIHNLDIKSIINLAETNKEMYYLIRKSKYAGILWNEYFNKIRNIDKDLDITQIKNPDQIFKLCALETFNYKKKTDRYLKEYFYYLSNKQIESYLNSKNVINNK